MPDIKTPQSLSAEGRQFLQGLREHPLFREVVRSIPQPSLVLYRPSKAAPETQFTDYVYLSGRIAEYDQVVVWLLGDLKE